MHADPSAQHTRATSRCPPHRPSSARGSKSTGSKSALAPELVELKRKVGLVFLPKPDASAEEKETMMSDLKSVEILLEWGLHRSESASHAGKANTAFAIV